MLKISSKMMRKHKRLVNRLNTRILFTHLHMSCASPKWILVCGADAISWKLLIWILPDYIASITASSAMCLIGTFGLVKFQYSTFQFIGSDWIKHNDNNKIQIAFSYLFSGSRKTSASMCTVLAVALTVLCQTRSRRYCMKTQSKQKQSPSMNSTEFITLSYGLNCERNILFLNFL